MKKKEFSFFDDEEAETLLAPDSQNEIEKETYYLDIWFWCRSCKVQHRWTECPKPPVN